MHTDLLDLIVCPQTGEKLNFENDELFSSKTSYPIFNEIPWIFNNPEFSFLEWGTKISSYINTEKQYLHYLDLVLKGEENKITKKRISKIIEAKSKNLKIFEEKLAIFLGHKQITLTPSTQQIHSYFQLIFRDWCWETEENDQYLKFIEKHVPQDTKSILVLGAGACGLSYKVAKNFPATQVVSTDHNPFLLFMAQNIFKGHETKLTDYSFFPKNVATTTHHWHIKVDKLSVQNHHFLLSGFPRLPFASNSFDVIIAPWFFDILDDSYLYSLNQAMLFLKPNGKMIAIGPANVHKKNISEQYCSDEQVSLWQSHFGQVESEQQSIHYLNNPIDSQSRLEEVLMLCGTSKQPQPIPQLSTSDHISFSHALQEYKAINDTIHRVLKLIDKDYKLDELAKLVEKEFGFSEQEALFYTDTIIKKIQLEL